MRNGESVFNGDGGSVREDENVLEVVVVLVAQPCECTHAPELHT